MDGREAGIEGRHDTFVIPALTSLGHIGLEQNLGLQDLSGRVRTLVHDRFERLTFFCAQSDDILPDLDLWHDPIPGNVDDVARESQMTVDFNDASY